MIHRVQRYLRPAERRAEHGWRAYLAQARHAVGTPRTDVGQLAEAIAARNTRRVQPAQMAARWVAALRLARPVAATVALAASAPPWGSTAGAAEQPWREFSWRAPAECPDRELVLHQLERLLQQHPVVLSSADVRGDIERTGSTWVLSLDVQVGTERRVRRVSAPSCDVLADAAAVALVLLLEPPSALVTSTAADTLTPALAEQPPTLPTAAPVASAELADAADQPPEAADPLPIAWDLGAALVFDSAALAAPTLGLSIESQLKLADWGVAAYGVLFPARRNATASGGFVDFGLWAGGMRLCHAIWQTGAWQRTLRVDGCAGAELGRFTGSGSGLNGARREARDWWFAPGAGAQLAWQALPHAALLIRLDAVFPVLQESYVINRDEEVHDTPAATFRASIGLELDLL